MIPTGRQIREARALLRISRSDLAKKVKTVSTVMLLRAESVDDEPPITSEQAHAIRRVFEHAGVEFLATSFGGARVRLRKTDRKDGEQNS